MIFPAFPPSARRLLLALAFAVFSLSALAADGGPEHEAVKNSLWAGWKERYARAGQGDSIYIADPSTGRVLSEAMGHALLLAVCLGDQPFFDGVLAGLDCYFLNATGLYRWELSPDASPHPDVSKSISASETEVNVLYALLCAEKLVSRGLWRDPAAGRKTYSERADALESLLWTHEVFHLGGCWLLLPSDGKDNPYWPLRYEDGTSSPPAVAWAPTYQNLAFFKAFAARFPRHDWLNLCDTAYRLLEKILPLRSDLLANDLAVAGKNPVPAWVYLRAAPDGQISIGNYFLGNTYEGARFSNEYDSIRVPMYVGLDWLWNRDKRALAFMRSFLALSGVDVPGKAYSGAEEKYRLGFNDVLAVGMYGVANKVAGNPGPFLRHLLSQYSPALKSFGNYAKYYYNQTFAVYAFLILSDKTSYLSMKQYDKTD